MHVVLVTFGVTEGYRAAALRLSTNNLRRFWGLPWLPWLLLLVFRLVSLLV